MNMFGTTFWVFAFLIGTLGSSSVSAALSGQEAAALQESLYPFLAQCGEEFGYSQEKIKILSFADLSNDDCFASCFYKKSELFKDDATFDADKAVEIFKKHVMNEDELDNLNQITEECAQANDEKVSDGDKGCERAKLVVECFNKHQAEILPE